MRLRFLALAILFVLTPSVGRSQAVPAAPAAAGLRVFLDCDFCQRDFLQVETPWVTFVRDRADGDVHLLLTSIETGGGGRRYDLEVIRQGSAPRRDTVIFSTATGSTQDAERREIVRNIQLALVPYAMRTLAGRSLRIAPPAKAGDDDDDRPRTGPDKWNAWVFEISSGASMEKEQRQSQAEFEGDLEARRITAGLKIGIVAESNYERSRFELDEDEGSGTITSTRESYGGGVVMVKSIGRKWGLGAEVAAGSSTFENTRLAIRAGPAIEYSIWPYEEATRRQLVFQYSLGLSSFRYREEETIFDRMSEVRPNQAFVIGYDVQQPWGSAFASLEAATYLDNFSQNRLELDTEWNLRIARGLELEFGGSVSRIHDQLEIPKRDATPEEILLERRALGTDYRFDLRVGFSFTFGSIFSSVVNPRFGSGPGEILR